MQPASLFTPGQELGRFARGQLNLRLKESVEHVLEASDGVLTSNSDRAHALMQALAQGAVSNPFLFAHFFALVDEIEGENYELAQSRLDDLLAAPFQLEGIDPICRYHPSSFDDEALAVIKRHFRTSEGKEIIALSGADNGPSFLAQAQRCRSMLQDMAPRTFAEIGEATTSLIIAQGIPRENGIQFGGISNLRMWSLICINETHKKNDLELCEAIAHECAHCTLFGLSPFTFFVENPESERYQSPLRYDPRPLDGIYHAVFVLARMHFAVGEMLNSGKLDAENVEEAKRLMERSKENFFDGYGVLQEHARYTDQGKLIIEDTLRYMNSV
ncbi:MAG: HEXXH motif-containing putative peptide modification protein [Pseudomonadota bacterium]